MSGPNPPEPDSEGSDTPEHEPDERPAEDHDDRDPTGQTDIHSQAYSAPESEQFTAGPFVPADPALYDYDDYDQTDLVGTARPPRWPWVVGIVAIIAAVSLVVSVSMLVMGTDSDNLANPGISTTKSAPPVQDEITPTTPTAAAPAPAAQRRTAASATGDGHRDPRATAAPSARGGTATSTGGHLDPRAAAADDDTRGSAPGDLRGDGDEGAGRHHHGHLRRRLGP